MMSAKKVLLKFIVCKNGIIKDKINIKMKSYLTSLSPFFSSYICLFFAVHTAYFSKIDRERERDKFSKGL